MVAAAIHACLDGKVISKEEKELFNGPVCSGKLGEFKKNELTERKILLPLVKICWPYERPFPNLVRLSKIQLSEGCARLMALVFTDKRTDSAACWLVCCYGLIKSYVR